MNMRCTSAAALLFLTLACHADDTARMRIQATIMEYEAALAREPDPAQKAVLRKAIASLEPLLRNEAASAADRVVTEADVRRLLKAPVQYNQGVVTLQYDWMAPGQLQDWTITGEAPEKQGSSLNVPALTVLKHNAVFAGPCEIRGELATGNRDGNHFDFGGLSAGMYSYNAWFVALRQGETKLADAVFDKNYNKPADPKKFMKFSLSILPQGVKLQWDAVNIAAAVPIESGQLALYGGKGGNRFKTITVRGTLDRDWAIQELEKLSVPGK